MKSKCRKQPSTKASGQKAERNDAIDFTETVQKENENEVVASYSISTKTVDEIMEGVISRDLAGKQVVDEETTQLTKNTATMDENSIDESTDVSDKEITRKCRFLDFVEYGDNITADKGFNVAYDLHVALCGVHLLIPRYTRGKRQLSAQEVEEMRQLARVHIHIEGVIGQLRKK